MPDRKVDYALTSGPYANAARRLGKRLSAEQAWGFTVSLALENAADDGHGIAIVEDKALRGLYPCDDIPAWEIYEFPTFEAFDEWQRAQVAA